MMKSRMRSISKRLWRLYSSMSTALKPVVGKKSMSRAMAVWIIWMEVLSSGSRKPLDRPMATTLRLHALWRMPVVKRSVRGSASAGPSRFFRSTAVASSSLMWRLQNTWPLPVRCCRGMRHCQPALCAVLRVYGVSGDTDAQGTAMARSQGSQCVQSS